MSYSTGIANRLGNRSSNQDRCLLLARGDLILLAVADGMGGHARGDLAAQAFIDSLGRQFRSYHGAETPAQFLRSAFFTAHRLIYSVGQIQKPPIAPLTTAVACLIQNGVAHWAHVGDSRAYLINQGRVAQRTRDHTPVADMVNSGLITEQQARQHPLRNQVSLCLGGRIEPPAVSIGAAIPLQNRDVLLLCSDGLWSALPEQHIADALANNNIARGLELLAEAADAASYPQSDNISGVVLRWECDLNSE